MPQIFSGESEGQDARNAHDEDSRRRSVAQTAAQAAPQPAIQAPAYAPTPINTTVPKNPTGNTILGPDRLHKYAFYIYVGRDHPHSGIDTDTPTNPGYRSPSASTSTITDAYAMAQTILPLIKDSSRVAIYILGSQWNENLILNTERIDLFGEGRPIVNGNAVLLPQVNSFIAEGIEFVSPNATEAFQVTPAPEIVTGLRSQIEFHDCLFHGPITGLHVLRRIYAERCKIWCDTYNDPSLETAALLIQAMPFDRSWSWFVDCTISGYMQQEPFYGPLTALTCRTYAIKATAKQGGIYVIGQPIGGPTAQFYMLPTSGVLLDNCNVFGSLLNEGWNVKHRHGAQHSGLPSPTRRGGIYCFNRGFVLFDDSDTTYGHLGGLTFFDHTETHSGIIAAGIEDPTQSPPYTWAGTTWFRHSEHYGQFDGAEASAMITMSGVHNGYAVKSDTGCNGFGGLCATWDCGTNLGPSNTTGNWNIAMFDPFII